MCLCLRQSSGGGHVIRCDTSLTCHLPQDARNSPVMSPKTRGFKAPPIGELLLLLSQNARLQMFGCKPNAPRDPEFTESSDQKDLAQIRCC